MFSTSDIFHIGSKKEFEKLTLKVFRHQYDHNTVYRNFCDLLKKNKTNVKALQDIPFLPIQFFKSHEVVSSTAPVQITFTSSGTTGMTTSRHLVTDLNFYEEFADWPFHNFTGTLKIMLYWRYYPLIWNAKVLP